jgi:dethiobiotin synthetase
VDLDAVFEAYDQAVGRGECLIVEGPGGLCTPWSEGFWTVHFAMMTALPLVVVVEAGVGAVNQSLLAAAVARSAGLKVAGVVLNRYRVDPDTRKALDRRGAPAEIEADDLAAYTNPSQISEHGGLVVLAIVPFDGESSVEQATLSFDVEFAVGVTDWQRVAGL